MKKKLLLRTSMLVLTFLVMNQPAKAQECYPWEIWSCYFFENGYNSGSISEQCQCVDTSNVRAEQCLDGQVLACRHHKCKYECECMDLSDAAKWIIRGNGCHNTGGGPYGHGHGGPNRSAVGRNSVAHLTFFTGLYPNPVSNFCTLSFSLSTPQSARIKIFDLDGRQVALLADQVFGVGDHEVDWNAEEIPAGLYIIQFQSKDLLHTETVVVMK